MAPAEYYYMNLSPYSLTEFHIVSAEASDNISEEL